MTSRGSHEKFYSSPKCMAFGGTKNENENEEVEHPTSSNGFHLAIIRKLGSTKRIRSPALSLSFWDESMTSRHAILLYCLERVPCYCLLCDACLLSTWCYGATKKNNQAKSKRGRSRKRNQCCTMFCEKIREMGCFHAPLQIIWAHALH